MYVITVEVEGEKEKFLAIDSDTGYPYWSQWLGRAKIFDTEELVRGFMDKEATFHDPWFNGAPMTIHSGLGLNIHKPSGTGVFSIKKIELAVVESETVTGVSGIK